MIIVNLIFDYFCLAVMDPSPPTEPRIRDKLKAKRLSQERPFYESPKNVVTPAQIVSEAKQELEVSI